MHNIKGHEVKTMEKVTVAVSMQHDLGGGGVSVHFLI